MAPVAKHADHDYIVARQKRFVDAWNSHSAEKMMDFMDKEDFTYSTFGMEKENLSHSSVEDLFARTFADFHDLKIKTRSLHGHKHFTAWEWAITAKALKDPDGNRLKTEEARPLKLLDVL